MNAVYTMSPNVFSQSQCYLHFYQTMPQQQQWRDIWKAVKGGQWPKLLPAVARCSTWLLARPGRTVAVIYVTNLLKSRHNWRPIRPSAWLDHKSRRKRFTQIYAGKSDRRPRAYGQYMGNWPTKAVESNTFACFMAEAINPLSIFASKWLGLHLTCSLCSCSCHIWAVSLVRESSSLD